MKISHRLKRWKYLRLNRGAKCSSNFSHLLLAHWNPCILTTKLNILLQLTKIYWRFLSQNFNFFPKLSMKPFLFLMTCTVPGLWFRFIVLQHLTSYPGERPAQRTPHFTTTLTLTHHCQGASFPSSYVWHYLVEITDHFHKPRCHCQYFPLSIFSKKFLLLQHLNFLSLLSSCHCLHG